MDEPRETRPRGAPRRRGRQAPRGEFPLTDRQSLGHDPRSFPGSIDRPAEPPRYGTGHGLGAIGGHVEGPYRGVGPRNYRREDSRIHEEAADRLMQHAEIDPSEVRLRVVDGEITLEGVVASRAIRRLVEEVCAAIRGVRDVHNHLRVAPPEP